MTTIKTKYYDVYETLPVTGSDNPKQNGKPSKINLHEKFRDREDAEAFLNKKRDAWLCYLRKEIDSAADSEIKQHLTRLLSTTYHIEEKTIEYTHACEYMYSDVVAYEIVKVISDKTIEVRKMDSHHDISKLKQISGGFFGHVVNQHNQEVKYASNLNNPVIRLRRKKNNPEAWTYKGFRFGLETKPYAFHDFNF